MIKVDGLIKSFPKGKGRTYALRGVTFSVEEGEIFGYLGPNGAGKTTTIKILTTIWKQDEGEAWVAGYNVRTTPGKVRERIGWLDGMNIELMWMTHAPVKYNIAYFASLNGIPSSLALERARELMELLDLDPDLDVPIYKYSFGMKAKLALVVTLLHNPDVLFLDEPTIGLDVPTRSKFYDMLRELREGGKTIFLSSHMLHEVEKVCDRAAILNRGEIVAVGRINELRLLSLIDVLNVRFRVSGDENLIREVLKEVPGLKLLNFMRVGKGEYSISFRVPRQSSDLIATANELLVKSGVKVLRIEEQIPSLEEAFLSLIGDENEPS